jgi:hypothetical protein
MLGRGGASPTHVERVLGRFEKVEESARLGRQVVLFLVLDARKELG